MYKNDNFIKEEKRILKPIDGGFAFSIMMAGYFLISFLGGAILNAFVKKDSVLYYAIAPLFSALTFFLILLFYKKTAKEKTKEFFSIKSSKPIYFLIVLLFAFGMLFGFGFFNDLIAKLIISAGGSVSTSSVPLDNFWQLILFTFALSLVPAVFEELFFRSFILGKALKDAKPITAILISALLFSLYHASATQLIYQFIYGIVLGLLFYKTKSVVCPCILHFLNNFLVLLFSYLKINVNFYSPLFIILGILAVVSAFVLTCFIDRNKEENSTSVKGLFIPYGIFGIAFCVLVIIVNLVA